MSSCAMGKSEPEASSGRQRINVFLILQITALLTLLSRGWLIYHFDSKIRSVLWSEEIITPLLKWLGLNWEEYHSESYLWIDPALQYFGFSMMLFGVFAMLLMLKGFKWCKWFLPLACIFLVAETYGTFFDSGEKIGLLLEYLLQALVPLLLFLLLVRQSWTPLCFKVLTILIATTFVGHGLFAVGYYPVPTHFQTMTMELLGCSEEFALRFLKWIGWLDLFAAVGVFIPILRKTCLFYMILWGAATALARLITMYENSQDFFGLDEGIAEFLVRTSHWSIPLLLLLYCNRRKLEIERAISSKEA